MKNFYKQNYARAITFLCALLIYSKLRSQDMPESVHSNMEQPAYQWEVGFQLMPTYVTFSMNNWDGTSVQGDAIIGLSRSIVTAVALNPTLSIGAEMIYTTFNRQFNQNGALKRLNVNYVSIPILATVNTSKMSRVNVNLVIGPQFGINAGSAVESADGKEPDSLQNIWRGKQGEMGVAYGVGLEFALNSRRSLRLTTGFRGISGFLDVVDNSTTWAVYYSRTNRVNVHLYSVYTGLTWLF
jgi:hypothetical protein